MSRLATVGAVHGTLIFGRGTRVISDCLADLLPDTGALLDVGCGDGTIDVLIKDRKPGLATMIFGRGLHFVARLLPT
jgi:methylase of polypeptide subunit release factors